MLSSSFKQLFYLDTLSITMIALISLISFVVIMFSRRYMRGDSHYHRFFLLLSILIAALFTMVAADHLFLMLLAWGVSNLLLIRLMIHKPQWRAARNAGLIAAKTFALGFASLTCAFLILYFHTKETSIQVILKRINPTDSYNILIMMLMLITAMTQSAIWPFHRWLLSSLNSPTPVSAMMHAGLVNGGGFLLARFAPLYLTKSNMLTGIFVLGTMTALLGTCWKLVQYDVKRMLACSTMAQMGFMLAQCGLGLFPAAVAHLCWHGMFKANLFLSSNSAAQEKPLSSDNSLCLNKLVVAIVCGLIASYVFSIAIHSGWLVKDSRLILIGLCFVMASQFALAILLNSTWQRLPIIILLTLVLAYFYGCSVYAIELIFQPLHLFYPQRLNIIHLSSLLIFVTTWIIMLIKHKIFDGKNSARLWHIIYMKSLNASQPHPSTVTNHRNHYRYN